MKSKFFLLLFCAFMSAFGQIDVKPYFPSTDTEITIIIDMAKVKDSRASGFKGFRGDIYVWTWGGYTDDRSVQNLKGPGQTNFNMATGTKMTYLEDEKWQVKIKPTSFFSANQPVKWFGILAKNQSGSLQTEDFLVSLYDPYKVKVGIVNTSKNVFVNAGDTVLIDVKANPKLNISLEIKELGSKEEALLTEATQFKFIVPKTKVSASYTAIVSGRLGADISQDSMKINIFPTPLTLEPPAGIKNGVNYLPDGQVILQILAPQKKFIYAIGEFNSWTESSAYLMYKWEDSFWIELKNLNPTTEYAYQYLIDGALAVADPFAEKILDPNNDKNISTTTYPALKAYPAGSKGIVSTFQIKKPNGYAWKVEKFVRPAETQLHIYELLVRDFSAAGNYRAVIDSLPYLSRLGINCIELMPIMEFSNNNSWGYNPTFYTAPDKAYGTPNDLKELIDKAHQKGIAVVLDMVLNQADYEYPYVRMYWDQTKPALNSPFFNEYATHPFSVFFDFNHESKYTKAITKQICDFWLKEFRFDGFRFDLSKGFTQKNSGSDVGAWGRFDASRIAIWKEYYEHIRKQDANAYVILEHFADENEENALMNLGMLTWQNLNGDFRTTIKGSNSNFRNLDFKNRGFDKPRAISYMESHDEERIGYDVKTTGLSNNAYNTKTLSTSLERSAAAAALFFLSPGPKMIWQFGELGYDESIDLNGRTGTKPIKWQFYSDPERQKLYKIYAQLMGLKNGSGLFLDGSYSISENGGLKTAVWQHPLGVVMVVANLTLEHFSQELTYPQTGQYTDFFTGKTINIENTKTKQSLKPGEFHIYATINAFQAKETGLVPWAAFSEVVLSTEPQLSIKSYPNPSKNHLTLDFLIDTDTELHILNSKGQIAHKETLKTGRLHHIDISLLPSGSYFLKTNLPKSQSLRFIKE